MTAAALATRHMPGTAVQIYDRHVGPGYPVFIIAEAGSNHNGDLAMALELITSEVKSCRRSAWRINQVLDDMAHDRGNDLNQRPAS